MAISGFEIPWLQVLVGGSLFLLPGITWVWALGGDLGLAQRVPLALLGAFTFAPATVYFLNLFLNVPLSLAVMTFVTAAVGLAGLAVVLRRHAQSWALVDPRPVRRR